MLCHFMRMNRPALLEWLPTQGIRRDAYDFSGDFGSETYVLRECPKGWEVYYSERGQKKSHREFSSEHEAGEFFRTLILNDASTRQA
ncbi:hypothetical protein LH19_12535 [Sphingopyxis macrogoltabida]|nr:hypothetical protein LH19_12535 [Sphingopyxis macrogoltabida]